MFEENQIERKRVDLNGKEKKDVLKNCVYALGGFSFLKSKGCVII